MPHYHCSFALCCYIVLIAQVASFCNSTNVPMLYVHSLHIRTYICAALISCLCNMYFHCTLPTVINTHGTESRGLHMWCDRFLCTYLQAAFQHHA